MDKRTNELRMACIAALLNIIEADHLEEILHEIDKRNDEEQEAYTRSFSKQ